MLVVDTEDEASPNELGKTGMRVHCTSTIMRKLEDRVALAKSVLEAAMQPPSPQVSPGARMILVPVKNLADAKQRLSSIFTPEERFALAQAMCEDVLQALADWQGRPAGCRGDKRSLCARPRRAFSFRGHRRRQLRRNKRHRNGNRVCRERGAASTLVVPADIPLIDSAELQKIVDCAPPTGAVLVPDAAGRGTNAAWRSPGDLFPLRFGNDSFLPHRAAAKATGLPCVVIELPSDCPGCRSSGRSLRTGDGQRTAAIAETRAKLGHR